MRAPLFIEEKNVMLKDVSLTIAEDAEGASNVDCEDRFARIDSAAQRLCDFVYEALLDYGITYGTVIDANVYRAIHRIVAVAMIDQYEYDKESWSEVIADIANASKEAVS
jgi:hypothetical protein